MKKTGMQQGGSGGEEEEGLEKRHYRKGFSDENAREAEEEIVIRGEMRMRPRQGRIRMQRDGE